jgi:hypothetical protein
MIKQKQVGLLKKSSLEQFAPLPHQKKKKKKNYK